MKHWCVIYGTAREVVWAATEDAAFDRYMHLVFPPRGYHYRLPPERDDVTISPLAAEDEGTLGRFVNVWMGLTSL